MAVVGQDAAVSPFQRVQEVRRDPSPGLGDVVGRDPKRTELHAVETVRALPHCTVPARAHLFHDGPNRFGDRISAVGGARQTTRHGRGRYPSEVETGERHEDTMVLGAPSSLAHDLRRCARWAIIAPCLSPLPSCRPFPPP